MRIIAEKIMPSHREIPRAEIAELFPSIDPGDVVSVASFVVRKIGDDFAEVALKGAGWHDRNRVSMFCFEA